MLRIYSPFRLGTKYFNKICYSSHAINQVKTNTIHEIYSKYAKGMPITMCTAYDYITANWVHEANCDMILVGDSLSMTSLGYDSTTDLPFEEFKFHVRSVCRAQGPAMIVADMPFGSFETSLEQGLSNSIDMMKLSSKVTSLKFEVGPHTKDRYTMNLVREVCSRGIPVVGHVGLTPQKVHALGGYKVQGNKTTDEIKELCETAKMLQEAGCWSLVLECVPHKVARYITSQLAIPTIGIGAGSGTSGQVLVISDALGMQQANVPKFVKQYAQLNTSSVEALKSYATDVREREFPDQIAHTFKIKEELWKDFVKDVEDTTAT